MSLYEYLLKKSGTIIKFGIILLFIVSIIFLRNKYSMEDINNKHCLEKNPTTGLFPSTLVIDKNVTLLIFSNKVDHVKVFKEVKCFYYPINHTIICDDGYLFNMILENERNGQKN